MTSVRSCLSIREARRSFVKLPAPCLGLEDSPPRTPTMMQSPVVFDRLDKVSSQS